MNIYGYAYLAGFALLFLYGIFHEGVQYLVAKEAKHRDKYANDVAKLQVADNLAGGIVANIAVDPAITKSDSKQAAVAKLDSDLQAIGINLDQATLERKIEAEYQSYKADGKDTHVAQSPLSEQQINNALDGAQTVANAVTAAKPDEEAIVNKVVSRLSNQGSGK